MNAVAEKKPPKKAAKATKPVTAAGAEKAAKGARDASPKKAAKADAPVGHSRPTERPGKPKKSMRNDDIVTARVPAAVKEQGNAVLKKIGSSPTELINAAYEYVLKHGELPQATPPLAKLKPGRRVLTPEQRQRLKERRSKMTYELPSSFWDGRSDKEVIAEAIRSKYESLA